MTTPKTPARVYLDTNALYGWPDPSFAVWNAFALSKWLKCEICIPAMVEMELEGQFVRSIETDRSEIKNRIKSIAKRGPSIIDAKAGVAMADPAEVREAFRHRSEHCKRHYQIRTAGLPTTPIEQLAEMAVNRTPTFEEIQLNKDAKVVTGFGDTLILLSVIEDVQRNPTKDQRCIFVSSDKVFAKAESKKMLRDNGVELMTTTFALWDDLKPFLTKAFLDPWTQEMADIQRDLNTQIKPLTQEVYETLFSTDVIDHLWPTATELDDFQLVRFTSAFTPLPDNEHLPPTVDVYRRPEGSKVAISSRAEIAMTGVALPNYLLGYFGSQPDDQGRRLFQATIDVSLTGTVANGIVGDFRVEGVSR